MEKGIPQKTNSLEEIRIHKEALSIVHDNTLIKKLNKQIEKLRNEIDEYKNKEKKVWEEENSIYMCPDEKDIPIEELEEAEKEALRILKEGDPVNYIRDVVQTKHIGDKEASEGILLSIADQSSSNSMGIHTTFNGESGSGKTHIFVVILNHIPTRFVFITSLTDKAAYYMDVKAGTIIFSDDTDMSEGMQEVFKRSTSNYQCYTYHTTVANHKGEVKAIPPRLNWYFTSVNNEVTDQVLNRQLIFSTVTDYKHKEDIYKMQQKENIDGEILALKVTKEVLICRRIFNEIKKQLFGVVIPFSDRIEMEDVSNLRVNTLFFDMIKGYTIFKFMQREKNEDGKLIATLEDFERAKKLFETQKDSIVSKLNENEIKIVNYIIEHPGCTINDIADGTGLKYAPVRNTLKGRKDRCTDGLLGKVKGLTVDDTSEVLEPDPLQEYSEEEMKLIPTKAYRKAERFRIKSSYSLKLYTGDFITLKDEVNSLSSVKVTKAHEEKSTKLNVHKPKLEERQQKLKETMEGRAV